MSFWEVLPYLLRPCSSSCFGTNDGRQSPLFFQNISAHFDQFHTIQQWLGNRIQIISGSDKHHLAQVIVDIQIVVVESRVLFRIQHFQQGGSRITLEVIRYFISSR